MCYPYPEEFYSDITNPNKQEQKSSSLVSIIWASKITVRHTSLFFLKSKISGPVSKESFHHQFVNNHYFPTGQSLARAGCCSLTSPLSEWNRFRPLGLLHGPGSTVQVRNQWCITVVQTCGIVPLGRAWGCHSA